MIFCAIIYFYVTAGSTNERGYRLWSSSCFLIFLSLGSAAGVCYGNISSLLLIFILMVLVAKNNETQPSKSYLQKKNGNRFWLILNMLTQFIESE